MKKVKRRVGITSNPDQTKKHWSRLGVKVQRFKVVKKGLTKSKAWQVVEGYRSRGYQGKLGGGQKTNKRYGVYTFDY